MGLAPPCYLRAKLAIWGWREVCQAWLMLSKNVDFGIFGELAGTLDLHLALAVEAEAVDPDPVLFGIGQRLDPAAQLGQRFGVQPALEDGVLNPFSKVLERMGQTRAPTIVGHIIRHHDQH